MKKDRELLMSLKLPILAVSNPYILHFCKLRPHFQGYSAAFMRIRSLSFLIDKILSDYFSIYVLFLLCAVCYRIQR